MLHFHWPRLTAIYQTTPQTTINYIEINIQQLTGISHSQPEWLSAGIHIRVDVLKFTDGRWFWQTPFCRWRRQLTRPHCFWIYRQASSSWRSILSVRAVVLRSIFWVTAACYSESTVVGKVVGNITSWIIKYCVCKALLTPTSKVSSSVCVFFHTIKPKWLKLKSSNLAQR